LTSATVRLGAVPRRHAFRILSCAGAVASALLTS
jgi:hypothetical protein